MATLMVPDDETPQQAAERIWKETECDPVETMKRFEAWCRGGLSKDHPVFLIVGPYWPRLVRAFLERNQNQDGAWRHSDSFRVVMGRVERKAHTQRSNEIRNRRFAGLRGEAALQARGVTQAAAREGYRRKVAGHKRVYADVDVVTGKVVSLIDKEYGPFKHIRINGLALHESTTEEALTYCDRVDTDTRFIRALCQMIPDPRKPIGEQWTAEMIREAGKIANR